MIYVGIIMIWAVFTLALAAVWKFFINNPDEHFFFAVVSIIVILVSIIVILMGVGASISMLFGVEG